MANVKYVIETNLDNVYFGAFVPGLDCRNVGIEEMKGYYYWPGDVFGVFMTLSGHALPDTMTYIGAHSNISAMFTCSGGDYFLRFERVSEKEAKESGLKEFVHSEWIDRLREDKKNGRNYRNYDK